MVTETQQAVFDEIAKYASLETAKADAKQIAEKVAKLSHIKSCSETYVRRLISRREKDSAKVHFKITPKEDEPEEEVESEESESDEESEDDEDYEEDEEPTELKPPDDWELRFDDDDEEEPESDAEVVREIRSMDISEIISKENCSTLIATPFRIAAEWTMFEGWLLSDSENKRLTPMFRAILIKYLPTVLAKYFAEIIFAVVIIEVVGSKAKAYRLFLDEQERAKKPPPKPEPSPEAEEEVENTPTSTKPHWMDGRAIG